MGSSLTIIDCKNCGGFGCIDNEYKEGIRITDCEDCDYRLEETYDIFTQEVYTKKETGSGSVKHKRQPYTP